MSRAGTWARHSSLCSRTRRINRAAVSRAGFTLVEIAFVVAIMALLCTISAPKVVGWLRSATLEGAARHLAGTVRMAHNQAALTGKRHRLVLDTENGSYSVECEDEEGEFKQVRDEALRPVRLSAGIRFEDVSFPSGDAVERGEVSIRVFPKGFMDETIIHLSDGKGRARSIVVKGWLGKVDVLTGYAEWEDGEQAEISGIHTG